MVAVSLDPSPALVLDPSDDVAIARTALDAGQPIGDGIAAATAIPSGHKIARRTVPRGAPVRKYGQVIGVATADIAAGDHVHSHNLAFDPDRRGGVAPAGQTTAPVLPEGDAATFDGIVRPDGRVATRNYVGVLTTVNCSATAARAIADRFRGPALDEAYPGVDGVVALTHQSGCGMASEGPAMDLLRRTLAGYARHPNFAGVLIIGLGCEANQIARLLEAEGLAADDRLRTMTIQDTGGTAATVHAGMAHVEALLAEATAARRRPVPARHLTVALQCGGSDAFSGLTANPALGVAADLIVRNGGTAVLAETPEIFGAEHLLLARAADPSVAKALQDLIGWWQDYARAGNASLDNNPSPGNKEGGLTTILEKSLGAVAKGGRSELVAVYRYAEAIAARGFAFMDSPGYDPVSVTGQVAGGSNVVCFTTGRGSCFGCKPVPSLKLCTNTPTYRRMADDMDINCGDILDGNRDVAEVGTEIFRLILETASGRPTKSEAFGYGDAEFAPWQLGITV